MNTPTNAPGHIPDPKYPRSQLSQAMILGTKVNG